MEKYKTQDASFVSVQTDESYTHRKGKAAFHRYFYSTAAVPLLILKQLPLEPDLDKLLHGTSVQNRMDIDGQTPMALSLYFAPTHGFSSSTFTLIQ